MNDMAITTRPIRRIRIKPAPLMLQPAWRVEVPAQADMLARARMGRLRALVAVQGKRDTWYAEASFAARVAAIAARHETFGAHLS